MCINGKYCVILKLELNSFSFELFTDLYRALFQHLSEKLCKLLVFSIWIIVIQSERQFIVHMIIKSDVVFAAYTYHISYPTDTVAAVFKAFRNNAEFAEINRNVMLFGELYIKPSSR